MSNIVYICQDIVQINKSTAKEMSLSLSPVKKIKREEKKNETTTLKLISDYLKKWLTSCHQFYMQIPMFFFSTRNLNISYCPASLFCWLALPPWESYDRNLSRLNLAKCMWICTFCGCVARSLSLFMPPDVRLIVSQIMDNQMMNEYLMTSSLAIRHGRGGERGWRRPNATQTHAGPRHATPSNHPSEKWFDSLWNNHRNQWPHCNYGCSLACFFFVPTPVTYFVTITGNRNH